MFRKQSLVVIEHHFLSFLVHSRPYLYNVSLAMFLRNNSCGPVVIISRTIFSFGIFFAIPCNTMQYHAIPCNTMQYHAIPCNTMQYHAIPCNTMQNHAIPCKTMPYHAIPCNVMQYNAKPMQYHASLITADKAYHCPVGSIMAIFALWKPLTLPLSTHHTLFSVHAPVSQHKVQSYCTSQLDCTHFLTQ